jgi:predicted RNA polymerase sigma factor
MSGHPNHTGGEAKARGVADSVARRSYGKLVALLAGRTGDLASAEDALSEAFVSALVIWPLDGCPSNPEAWLLADLHGADATLRELEAVAADPRLGSYQPIGAARAQLLARSAQMEMNSPGHPGRLPAPGSHRSVLAQLRHTAPHVTSSLRTAH